MPNNPAPGFAKHPQYRVVIADHGGRVRVTHGDTTLADTTRALKVEETDYAPVYYIPREDVAMDELLPFARNTYCPFKGDASYWALADAADGEPVAWSYDAPYDEAARLAGHVAFYADQVSVVAQ